ncbi:MAG TPA: T9SS type A sorting domain-containing protein, partial [Flavobacteriales bacterium]|nr:T9SS type A sorting domain-containing protein [Flavobacteriales bacterium]
STSANYVHPDLHGIIANPLDPNKIYIVTDGGLFRSNNFGYNSFECTSGYVTSQFYIGSVSAYDPTIALGGLQDNCTFLYDGIPSWYLVAGGDGCFNAIDPTNDYIMYASEQGLQVYKSIDQGYNFSPCYLHAGYAAFIAPLVMCPSNASVLYAGGDYMIKTTDAGATWTPVGPNPLSSYSYVLSIGVSSTSTDTLYCGMEPWSGAPMKILRSTDGGTSYTDITGSLPDRYPRDMVVNPNNSNEVYVIFSGFGTGHIFKSSDAGASWTDISTTLPDVPFHCMAVNPYNVNMLFAGSDLGVFSSTDGGATWSSFTTGMPMAAMVFDLVVSPSDTTIMAYTHGNGVYKRKMEDAVGMTEATLSNSSIRVFPNPASTEIMVESAQTIQALALYAFNGQHMPNTVVSKGVNTATVDVCKIPGGMYFLVIHAGNGTFTQRIVIGK